MAIIMVASWACEVTDILTQRSTEEASFVCGLQITSPTSNHIPDIDITVSVIYDTYKKKNFHTCVLILFNPSFLTVR